MPLPTTAVLPFGDPSITPLELKFTEARLDLRQQRFADRITLKPKLDLSDYRFEAVIDWIEFRVALKTPTQHRYLQDVLLGFLERKSMVTPVTPGPGDVSQVFDIKIHDPKSLAYVLDIYDALVLKFGERTDPLVCGVEFSLDACPRVESEVARRMLFGVLQRTIFITRDIWTNRDSQPRSIASSSDFDPEELIDRKLLVAGKGENAEETYLAPHNHRPAFIDGTMYLGDRDTDDVMIRIMDKIKDRQHTVKKTHLELSDSEKRVRIEVRIEGHELIDIGFFELKQLDDFAFSKLQGRYFQFKLPTFRDVSGLKGSAGNAAISLIERWRAETFLKTGVVGLDASDRARAKRRQGMLPGFRAVLRSIGKTFTATRAAAGLTRSFVAYEGLNLEAAGAFRRLGNREGTAWAKRARRELS